MMTPSRNHSQLALRRFFQSYDSLQREASTLDADRQSLQAAQSSYKGVAEAMEQSKAAVEKNIAFITEQKDRIELVSSHWFFGTTLYQPQLWLRGGCQGKIDRAKEKLETAEKQHPILEETLRVQHEKETAANEMLRQKEAAFGRAADADKEAKRMKEDMAIQHPTYALNSLVQDEATLKKKIEEHHQRKNHIENTRLSLNDATRCATNAESHVKAAEDKLRQIDGLATEGLALSLPSGGSTTTTSLEDGGKEVIKEGASSNPYRDYTRFDDAGNIVMTNHPCPSGCGFVVTFHPTHCCAACSNPNNGGGCHGKRCEGIPLASQEGATELWKKFQRQRQAHEKKLDQMRHHVQRELHDANRELQKGFGIFRRACASLNGGSVDANSLAWMPPAGSCCSGSCSCCPVSTRGSQVRAQAHQLQLAVKDQEFDLRLKKLIEDQEGKRLNEELNTKKSQIADEKDAIFASLRISSENDGDYDDGDTLDDSWERPPAMSPHYNIPVSAIPATVFDRPPPTAPRQHIPVATASLINNI